MQRTQLRFLLIALGLIGASATADAQVYRYPDRGAPYGRDDPWGRQGRYGSRSDPAGVVQRVISDLHYAGRSSYADRHEYRHFDRAISELEGFRERWIRQGRIETGHLDRAIDNMKHLAEARQLDGRARRVIDQDINVLRDLRARVRRYRD